MANFNKQKGAIVNHVTDILENSFFQYERGEDMKFKNNLDLYDRNPDPVERMLIEPVPTDACPYILIERDTNSLPFYINKLAITSTDPSSIKPLKEDPNDKEIPLLGPPPKRFVDNAVTPDLPVAFIGAGRDDPNGEDSNYYHRTFTILLDLAYEKNAGLPWEWRIDKSIRDKRLLNADVRAEEAVYALVRMINSPTYIEEYTDPSDRMVKEREITVPIDEARLGAITPYAEGLSNKAFTRFEIEIDWRRPV